MIGFSSLIAQHQPVKILEAILFSGAIPHALLFTGIEGVGKRTAALAFAMALNCSEWGGGRFNQQAAGRESQVDTVAARVAVPCGNCRSCRKIESGKHPDIISVQPTGPLIRIDQIRELCRVLAMKPYEAEYRMVVISEAHCMNAEAGNALLKMLEEPPDRTILILTASTTADMLPTIVSRCRHIRFHPIPIPRLAQELMDTHGMDPENAHALAVLSGGSLTRAKELPGTNWIQRRKWLIESMGTQASRLEKGADARRVFAVASMLFPNRESALDSLDILKTFYRDVLIYKYQPENLLNPDVKEKIADTAACMDDEEIMGAVKAIDTARDRIRANASVRLVLETLFLQLAKSPEMN